MIPYTVERRPDTGVTNVTLGIWLFLASEMMLYGALFSAYALLRTTAPGWPSGRDVLNLPLGSLNTIVLAAAIGSALFAWAALQRRRLALVASAVLAVLFAAILGLEYRSMLAHNLQPSANTFIGMYFTLTGLHALHMLGGAIANLWVVAGANRAAPALTAGRVSALTLYWIFLGVMWLIMFVLLYQS